MDQTSIVSEANLKGDIVSVNKKFIEVSKYPIEELLGKPHNTTRHPDMPKEAFKEMWATIGKGNLFRGVVKNRAKDGSPYYVDACIAPLVGSNGKPRKYLGVRYQFTKAELERQSANGTVAALDETYVRAEFDVEGRLAFCNKHFEKMMLGTFDHFKGKLMSDLFESSWARDQYPGFWKALCEGKTQSGVSKVVTKDGSLAWLQSSVAAVKNEVGTVLKFVLVGIDITYTKSELDGKLDAISKAQAVVEFNLDGSIITANENFLRTLGYSLDEIKGKHHRMFCEDKLTSSPEYRAFWDKLNRGEFEINRYKRISKAGKVVWMSSFF